MDVSNEQEDQNKRNGSQQAIDGSSGMGSSKVRVVEYKNYNNILQSRNDSSNNVNGVGMKSQISRADNSSVKSEGTRSHVIKRDNMVFSLTQRDNEALRQNEMNKSQLA